MMTYSEINRDNYDNKCHPANVGRRGGIYFFKYYIILEEKCLKTKWKKRFLPQSHRGL